MRTAAGDRAGPPAAILIRAAEPLRGLESMARGRGFSSRGAAKPQALASGPAKLCQAFGIDLRLNRTDLRGPDLWIEPGEPIPDSRVAVSRRLGWHSAPPPRDQIPWRRFEARSPVLPP